MKTSAETHFRFEDTANGELVQYRLERIIGRPKKTKLFKGKFDMRDIAGIDNGLLQPKVLEVLACFLRHPQQELKRDAIIEEVWPDDPNGGGSLDHYVSALRKLLQDQPPPDRKSYRLIANIRDKGFKFLQPVSVKEIGTATSDGDASSDLEPYRRKWHHYHLTLHPTGKPVWIYKIVDFKKSSPQEGRLAARVTILPDRGADPRDHQYRLEASLNGPHLIFETRRLHGPSDLGIELRRLHGRSDIGIELFPHVGPERFPTSLYSARINQSWYGRTVTSSIGILTLTRRGKLSKEGPVLSKRFANVLQGEWEAHSSKNSEIVRLPLGSLASKKDSTPIRIREKWHQGQPSPIRKLGEPVECCYIGDDPTALKHVVEQYRRPSRSGLKLIGIRDTHARPEMPMRRHEDHKNVQKAVIEFLRHTDADDTVATFIFGWEVNKSYVKMVQAVARRHGDKVKCYQLQNPVPLMSFILLDYDDLTSEVFFGWGQGKPNRPGAVFRSRDVDLVEEFNTYYDMLFRASKPVDVKLLIPPNNSTSIPTVGKKNSRRSPRRVRST
ncbi:MAG TPA: helix-turn-helix domain-containing protein [Candidatus Angelobacter sp.]|jgi:DNA-binding winged helix-turn-helix (wHTH) protein|nr:helix-turn-helix domain-containing protein [Candidatus Angelobacter sp.]